MLFVLAPGIQLTVAVGVVNLAFLKVQSQIPEVQYVRYLRGLTYKLADWSRRDEIILMSDPICINGCKVIGVIGYR